VIRTAIRSLFLGFLILTCARAAAGSSLAPVVHSSSWSVLCQPAKPVNGSPILLEIKAPSMLNALAGKWQDHVIYFEFDSKSKTWYGIAGTSVTAAPGRYPLTLSGTTLSNEKVSFQQQITISRGKYPSASVKVATKFTEPNPLQQEEIKKDQAVKDEVFKRVAPEQQWEGKFVPPVQARISDVFGTRRVFNGRVQSVHQGLDYGVPAGTPVLALNRGTVLLARPLYFEGNCVVIDHGQGLLTMYLHLSEFKVKEGETVQRGAQIGISGGTGRATGPHLHVAVRWQGLYLNPATLYELPLP
jgi:murein DD-endopeptidase MepM/ murein hydrolase activator NlpD